MKRSLVVAILVGIGLASWGVQDADAARRRIRFEDTEIVAEVQKPPVAVFISRENLHKSYRLELRESFIPRILDSVETAPF